MWQMDYPLYYDAVNEKGARYGRTEFCRKCSLCRKPEEGKQNVAQYEFIPWLLSQCADACRRSEKQAF